MEANSGERSQEARLVGQAVKGDAEAFTALYDAYVERIYRFILLRVEQPATAEDLTSSVFIKAWEALGSYKRRRGAPFHAWLFRIARNAVIDHYRTAKETEPLEGDLRAESRMEEKVETQIEAEKVKNAMQKLTAEQQEVLTLKLIEGYSTSEVAKILGKKQGAVRALQMRGLQALAEILEADGD